MIGNNVTHVSFSDESNWNVGRYRCLGMVSLRVENLEILESELKSLLCEANIQEFKWNKLQGSRYSGAAKKMCDFAVKHAREQRIRVDVLMWDIEDSRHKVKGRDDVRNINIMYYHLLRNVLRKRWPDDAVWELFPDEHTQLDWQTLQDCLENVSTHMDVNDPTLFNRNTSIRILQEFSLAEIHSVVSEEQPLLQLADLFAGMTVFSYQNFCRYQTWKEFNSPQGSFSFMKDEAGVTDVSQIAKVRFDVLQYFDTACKQHRLGMSLKSKKGLQTPDPCNPLNFWMYVPQHQADKAPLRV